MITAIESSTSPTDDWQARLDALSLQPLWDSKLSLHTDVGAPDNGNIWHWSDMREVMVAAGELSSPEVVQRRVVEMLDPRGHYAAGEGTIGTINACFQLLKPGESARVHRHSMSAIRFVVESTGGAKTIVDGKELAMEEGDLVLTPAWCWHQHVHAGTDPVIWLDVLDLAMHRFLRTEQFQPGPIVNPGPQYEDAAFETPNIVPVLDQWKQNYSPVFRYSWADASKALDKAPEIARGVRMVRYANPINGEPALPFMDMMLLHVDQNCQYAVEASPSDLVICPMRGSATITIGGEQRTCAKNDVISVPVSRPLQITPTTAAGATFFVVSNAPVFKRLGFLENLTPQL